MADTAVVVECKQSLQVLDARFPASCAAEDVPVVERDESEGRGGQNQEEHNGRSAIATENRYGPMRDHNIDSSSKYGIGILRKNIRGVSRRHSVQVQ